MIYYIIVSDKKTVGNTRGTLQLFYITWIEQFILWQKQ